ncbi:hypothetical protein J7E79_02810 [Bacillus sp. ISL-40]|uniref:hypothetical protein n=1 Tax=unclassified Bacillus (in: firmicutes) TaxID=185979 RepID=UPI001BE9103D|nr:MULTISPECIES: hypothetical protein [unclassified Bacillus (in: firmicutes)]MBT2696367.1 hypothetical protein [Bacillus sp. ISL-40]MBT2743216.1 hypothetical protein [Bacillus sp. ISL-77]
MSEQERLSFLLSYHRNLSLQLANAESCERESINAALGNLELKIEALLFKD